MSDNSYLVVDQRIIIEGVTGIKRILSVSGTIVTIDFPADASVPAGVGATGAVSWSAPTFETLSFGGGAPNVSTATGTLAVANGGTGVTALGTGFVAFAQTPSSAKLAALLTDETGTGQCVFGTSPTFKTNLLINNPANTFAYAITPSAITAARSLTIPLLTANDTFVVLALAQALTNKTIDAASNTISNLTPANNKAAQAVTALSIDWNAGAVFTKTLAAGSNTFTFANASGGKVIMVRLAGAGSTVTWPTVKWPGGTVPTQTASGTDVYTFMHDGTSIYGSVQRAMA